MITTLFFASIFIFAVAYLTYGRLFLQRVLGIDPDREPPSRVQYDGIDFVPTRAPVLLGHHFSSIAGAGPIVGPIIAAIAFGWLPAVLWIVVGSIFLGGAHDFSALVASVKHRARSIAEMASLYMSPVSYRVFLVFIWLTLAYVLVVFLDLTARTFATTGGVATSSVMYILMALAFGLCLYRLKWTLLRCSLVFVPLVFVAIWAGRFLPMDLSILGMNPQVAWDFILLAYCYAASVTPVWILLQPRDYLSSFLLYAALVVGVLGILLGGFTATYPAFMGWVDPKLGPLFPILFITIACGAVSGFHSIVGSGTTSKQISGEEDALPVGYGGMLLEGVVAIIALVTVMMLPLEGAKGTPAQVFASGIGRFFEALGLSSDMGVQFGLLAISTFLLTTLDTGTRLGRFIFQEFFDMRNRSGRWLATAASLVIPASLVLMTLKDPETGAPVPAWQAIWPVFGATNQLLAALALMVVAVWLRAEGKRTAFVVLPMMFMMVMTLWSLGILILKPTMTPAVRIVAAVLVLLALTLAVDAVRAFCMRSKGGPEPQAA